MRMIRQLMKSMGGPLQSMDGAKPSLVGELAPHCVAEYVVNWAVKVKTTECEMAIDRVKNLLRVAARQGALYALTICHLRQIQSSSLPAFQELSINAIKNRVIISSKHNCIPIFF